MIRWGYRLQSIDNDHVLHFDRGVEKGFDLIIGAEGAWSKTRNLLSSVKPVYSGVAGHNLSIPDAEKNAPAVYKLVNRGSVFVYSDGKSLTGQQLGDGSINIGAWSLRGEGWMKECGYDPQDASATKEVICKEYDDWAPELLELVQQAEGDVAPRSFYMLPVGTRWDYRAGVTLIGDAAHLMTPFAGEGVNLAFEDGMKLAKAIIDASEEGGKHALTRNIQEYEEDMFKRAKKTQELTYGMMRDILFTEGAPRTSIEAWITRKLGYDCNPMLYPFIVAAVYAYFFCFKLIY
ncbi:hypothetical protein MMC12_006907 [Toensbergia leucococca]|nr:hypothetical protein [Toensbergia leucococca]